MRLREDPINTGRREAIKTEVQWVQLYRSNNIQRGSK